MSLAEAVTGWHQFYLGAASVAAVLLGLVFVGMSIHYDLRRVDRRLVAMATESAVPFFYATLVCLLMLMPPAQPWVPSGALLLVGALASVNAGAPLYGRWYAAATRPGPERRVFDGLRYVLPVLAALALMPVALWLAVAPEAALYGVAVVVLVFIAFGMQNAWDVLLRRDLRGRAEASPPDDGER